MSDRCMSYGRRTVTAMRNLVTHSCSVDSSWLYVPGFVAVTSSTQGVNGCLIVG